MIFSILDDDVQPVPEQRLQNPELADSANFAQLPKKKKKRTREKVQTLGKKRTQKRIPAPRPSPIYKLSMMPMVWNISVGQPR